MNCEVGFSTAAAAATTVVVVVVARYDSRSRRSGNAQKDALNGNFAALGDNWALRRHVIIPATVAKAGALLKLPEFMDSAGGSERGERSERASSVNFSPFGRRLWPLFFGDSTDPRRFPGLALTSKTNDRRLHEATDRVGRETVVRLVLGRATFSDVNELVNKRSDKVYSLFRNLEISVSLNTRAVTSRFSDV